MENRLISDTQTNRDYLVSVVMQIEDARKRGRYDIFDAVAAEDVVVKLVGNRSMSPFVGTFRGRMAGRQALENLSIEFEHRDIEIHSIMVDGDQVGMRWTGMLRNRGTSAKGAFEGFLHITFRDGFVAEYAAFIDTAALAHLADWNTSPV